MICRPLPNIRIEVWQTVPGGEYDATTEPPSFLIKTGAIASKPVFSLRHASRPSHIHILLDAKGFEGLINTALSKKGSRGATFDLVIVPETESNVKKKHAFWR